MKKYIYSLLFLVTATVMLTACHDDEDIIGKVGALPKFSIEEYSFIKEGGKVVTRQTDSLRWVIYHVSYAPKDSSDYVYVKENEKDLNVYEGYKKYIGPWFRIERTGERTIEIEVDKNNTGDERKIDILACPYDTRNGWTSIKIEQEK